VPLLPQLLLQLVNLCLELPDCLPLELDFLCGSGEASSCLLCITLCCVHGVLGRSLLGIKALSHSLRLSLPLGSIFAAHERVQRRSPHAVGFLPPSGGTVLAGFAHPARIRLSKSPIHVSLLHERCHELLLLFPFCLERSQALGSLSKNNLCSRVQLCDNTRISVEQGRGASSASAS